MPSLFKVGPYMVYFWANEGNPLEPVHVHVSEGIQSSTATKIWITHNGKCVLCHNHSKIPLHILKRIMSAVEANSRSVIEQWCAFYDEEPRFIL